MSSFFLPPKINCFHIKCGSIGINIAHRFRDGSGVSSISCRSCNRKRYQSVEDAIADGMAYNRRHKTNPSNF
ncbi:hypothetical protein QUA27_00125 [Microcoleus sp. Pol14C6]|uniref:hypothetical protein n=1 Tax=Microcoleus sp. Pol14C6 TaxID=3055399 RepID=UPI002FD49302